MQTCQIDIYTDGSSRGNPGPGGYGIVMELVGTNHRKEFSEGFHLTTNNRMELLAVIVALEKLKQPRQKVTVFTDSKYVSEAVKKRWIFGWEKKGFQMKKNTDLWQRFLKIYRQHQVAFQWIKGHNHHLQNERCHWLATKITQNQSLKTDWGYEQQHPLGPKCL